MPLPAVVAVGGGLAGRSAARRALVTGGRRAFEGVSGFFQPQRRQAPRGRAFPGARRGRGRGISASELRGFRKVANLIRMFTAPGRRTIFKAPRKKRRF